MSVPPVPPHRLVGDVGLIDDHNLVVDVAIDAQTRLAAHDTAIASAATAATTESTARAAADLLKMDKAHMPAIAADAAGVDNTGATDTGTALQTFLNSLAGTNQIARLYGTFKHAATILFNGNVDATGATFNYTGSTVAVQVGAGGSGVRLDRVFMTLPKIVNTTKPGTGWTSGTVGVKMINVNSSFVTIPYIVGFETGVWLYGDVQGCVYDHFFIGQLDNNKRNLFLDGNSGGWITQNNFYGGRYSHNSGEGSLVSGVRHILINNTMTTIPNNNTWYGPSLESPGVTEYVIEALSGTNNLWDRPRFEWIGSGAPTIHWGATAIANKIRNPHHGDLVVEIYTSGATRNDFDGDTWSRHSVSGTRGYIFENAFSTNSPQIMGLRAGGTAAGDDPTTAYVYQGTGSMWSFKRSTDAFDRVQIDAVNGQILVGNGTATPTTVLGPSVSSVVNTYATPGTFTWTKPGTCNAVMALCISAGAGGGSGRRGAAGSVRCGGGGGGGGGYSYRVYPASVLSSSETVVVGAGGTGGAAQTVDSTDGNIGSGGGASYFKTAGVTQMAGPNGGGPGTATTGVAGTSGMVSPSAGGAGGAASTTGGVGVAPTATNVGGATGGGSGGGITSADAASAGGAGAALSGIAGGVAGTTGGGTGGTGTAQAVDQPGTGGGGGGSSITGLSGTGGAGIKCGGGGGGGGASLNGNNSGAGGAGADGFVMLIAI